MTSQMEECRWREGSMEMCVEVAGLYMAVAEMREEAVQGKNKRLPWTLELAGEREENEAMHVPIA